MTDRDATASGDTCPALHCTCAAQAGCRAITDPAARRALWIAYEEWLEKVPAAVPDEAMPWDAVPDPVKDPTARIHAERFERWIPAVLRSLIEADHLTLPDGQRVLRAIADEMDRQERDGRPVGYAPCAWCGQLCPRPGQRYCRPAHRQAAYAARKRERETVSTGAQRITSDSAAGAR